MSKTTKKATKKTGSPSRPAKKTATKKAGTSEKAASSKAPASSKPPKAAQPAPSMPKSGGFKNMNERDLRKNMSEIYAQEIRVDQLEKAAAIAANKSKEAKKLLKKATEDLRDMVRGVLQGKFDFDDSKADSKAKA